jgi:hypothetical protein
MGFCFLGRLFFQCHPDDYSPDPFCLAEDGLKDNNLVAADFGANSPDDFGACYFLTGFVALPKTEPSCHSL